MNDIKFCIIFKISYMIARLRTIKHVQYQISKFHQYKEFIHVKLSYDLFKLKVKHQI